MHRRDFLAAGSAAALTLATRPALAAPAPAAPADAKLNATFDAIVDRTMERSPEFASSLGFDKGAHAARKHRLGDRSRAGMAGDLAETKRAIAEVSAVDASTLSPAARMDREVVLYNLRLDTIPPEKFGIESVIRPYRIFQQGGAYFSIPDFLNAQHTIATAEDADAYCDRLEAFATALDQDSAVQKEEAARGFLAPSFSLDLTLAQMAKLRAPAPADTGMVHSLATRMKAKGLAGDQPARAAKIVGDKVFPALDRQIALIQALRPSATADAGVWKLKDGAALYAAALASATTTDLTPDQVHRLGLDQVAEISAKLDAILKSQGMTQGSVGARLTALNTNPAQLYPDSPEGRTALIADLNTRVKDMMGRLPRAFATLPQAPLEIRAVPVEIQDGASNGYYVQAPLDRSRPAIYFINLKDVGDWPKYGLPALTYHEGVPGHHLQISIAQETPTPLIRKLTFFGAYIEGWALYAEQLGDELGAYTNPLERAGYLQSFLFRAARLVVDTGIHTKKWSCEQATDYLVQTTGFARPRSQREVERYCTQPGQACSYKVGHMAWTRARADAEKAMGSRFDLRQFHEVLHEGALPLTMLEQRVMARTRMA